MTEKMEARIALCKCKEGKRAYGVRFERAGQGWKYTWAFPLKEAAAKREGYDKTQLVGNISPGADYPGCPFCKAKYFIICSCGKLNCNNANDPTAIFKCEWCGATGKLAGGYDGSGFGSGGDI